MKPESASAIDIGPVQIALKVSSGFWWSNKIKFEDTFQPFVTWIADLTANVIPESVAAIRVGLDPAANNCLAIRDAKNMDSVGMEPVFVRKDGMDAIARYVRSLLLFYIRKSPQCKLGQFPRKSSAISRRTSDVIRYDRVFLGREDYWSFRDGFLFFVCLPFLYKL